MPVEVHGSSTRQDGEFKVKKNESTKDVLYPSVLPLNKLHNRFWINWIDKNTKGISFNTEDTVPYGFLDMADYTIQKSMLSFTSIVQDFKPDVVPVVDLGQYARLKAMLQEEVTESGIINPSENIIESLYSEDKQKTNMLLNKLFIENFHSPHIVVGVLHIISHFDYDLVSPEGQTMAIAALSHKDVEVKEYGVKCFENWQHKDGVMVLEQIKAHEGWLQNYINLVIHDLKRL
jgi:hypothetical protein